MTDLMTADVDTLWRALLAARHDDDHEQVRAIENRMRDLQVAGRFAHLTDIELHAKLRSLDSNRAPTGLLAYSPGGTDGDAGVADLPRLNRAIAAQQHVGVEELRRLLLDEVARRAA